MPKGKPFQSPICKAIHNFPESQPQQLGALIPAFWSTVCSLCSPRKHGPKHHQFPQFNPFWNVTIVSSSQPEDTKQLFKCISERRIPRNTRITVLNPQALEIKCLQPAVQTDKDESRIKQWGLQRHQSSLSLRNSISFLRFFPFVNSLRLLPSEN